jgi:DivIVA domain-containing protein
VFWLQVVVAVGIVLATVLVAGGRGDGLAPVEVNRQRTMVPEDRALVPADLEAVDLGVGFRGYRMDEVDELLDRMALELAERDERIAELEEAMTPAPGDAMRTGTAAAPRDAGRTDG